MIYDKRQAVACRRLPKAVRFENPMAEMKSSLRPPKAVRFRFPGLRFALIRRIQLVQMMAGHKVAGLFLPERRILLRASSVRVEAAGAEGAAGGRIHAIFGSAIGTAEIRERV